MLFRHLDALVIPATLSEVHVLIVDNNRGPEARSAVENWQPSAPLRVHYHHEPTPGLTQARNASLRVAGELGDLVLLLDDDEIPDPGWLAALVSVWATTATPLLNGPVRSVYPLGTPGWIQAGRFFDLPEWPDGALLEEGLSGNALLHLPTIAAAGLRFDDRLATSGGEDQLFFRQARSAGLDIRFVAGAVVSEPVPAARATFRYLLRREYRKGTTLGFLARHLPELGEGPLYRSLAAVKWCVLGMAILISSPFRGQPHSTAAGGLLRMARAVGMAGGLLGRTYQLYARTGGDRSASRSPATIHRTVGGGSDTESWSDPNVRRSPAE